MADAVKNFAVGIVSTPPSPPTTGTTLRVQTAQGGRFPAVPFNATVWPAASLPDPGNAEIVRVTAIAGDQLTITRGAEASAARAIVVGDLVAAALTKGSIDNFAKLDAANTFAGNVVAPFVSGVNGILERNRSAPIGEWVNYAVPWMAGSASGSIGNGTLTGRYTMIGRTVLVEILLMVGTTTTFPADPSAWMFTVPVVPSVNVHLGQALGLHGGWYDGAIVPASATQVLVLMGTGAAISNVSNTTPWTWAVNDQLRLSWQYMI